MPSTYVLFARSNGLYLDFEPHTVAASLFLAKLRKFDSVDVMF